MKRTTLARKTPLKQVSAKKAVAIKPSGLRLRQGRSTGKPTLDQAARMGYILEIGCLADMLEARLPSPPDIHHLTVGGLHGSKRRGHDFTIGLCPWHHRGIPPSGMTVEQATKLIGPSYALDKRGFRQRYGCDNDLLELQNKLIALREASCV